MARGLKACIVDDVVVNIVAIDTNNIPDHMVDWPDGTGLVVGMIDDGSGGYAHYVPTQAEVDAEVEAQVQANTDDILQNDKKFKVALWLIYHIIRAINTGDNSNLAVVTSQAKLRDIVVERFRNI